jgi:hypothetical protein
VGDARAIAVVPKVALLGHHPVAAFRLDLHRFAASLRSLFSSAALSLRL